MKRLFKISLLFLLVLGSLGPVLGQATSNKGKDFWLGYGNHVRGYTNNSQQMSIYITSDVNTTGKIEVPGVGYSNTFSVTANSITTVDIPQSAYLQGEGLYDLGIHITSEKPVVVYSHIYNRNVSGATLVLPVSALGKEYYSINYTQISNEGNSYSYFFVIAVEDNTQVEITPSAATQNHPAGVPFIVNLKKGQVYQVLGQNTFNSPGGFSTGVDLTGSTIRSITTTAEPCKRIAVFSGSGKIAIGCGEGGGGSSDNLYQQVYPTSSWGKKFITAPLKGRNYDIFRILKSVPAAVVKINGKVVNNADFINNLYYEFDSQTTNVVESDKPIQVVQYAVTQGRSINCSFSMEATGDPEMIFLNSVEQNIDQITVYSSSAYLIIDHYINVVIETEAAGSFRLDGASALFNPVPGDPAYSFARLSVTAGVHTLKADKGFNAIAYGFGNVESYGYSAGANVKSLGIQMVTRVNNLKASSGCLNEPLQFLVNLPYEATKLTWNLNDGAPQRVIKRPVPNQTYIENDRTYYVYVLPDTIKYSLAKDYQVDLIAENLLSDGCGSNEQLFFDFSIFKPPLPNYSNEMEECAGENFLFKDESDGQGRPLTTWLWDFGDPSSGAANTSSLQNPGHVFAKGGTYQVKLTVTNESFCEPVSVMKEVKVRNRPVADFSFPPDICETVSVTFTDRTVLLNSVPTKWEWDFGDGQFSSEKDPIHVYIKAGTYAVTLRSASDEGCVSETATKTVTVNKLPVVDFELPKICLEDSKAYFVNQSVISGDPTKIKYLWNFGDASAHGRPNTSNLKDAEHTYIAAGYYLVTLTVISQGGCETILSKTLTVNGSIPNADFVIVNPDKLCSSQPVIFEDQASVDFGEITRIEWIYDFGNEPERKEVDENPNKRGGPIKRYEHRYPVFGSPAAKTYTVKMLAYSGGVCVDEQVRNVIVKAEPEVMFDSIGVVCVDRTPFQLTQGRLINTIPGQGSYSGPGVSASGMFKPASAGAGVHTLTYTYNGLNSCQNFKTQTITVIASPAAEAGEDLNVLQGEQVKLKAKASGDGFRYRWTPATGLDRDDVLNPMVSPEDDTAYTLTVTSSQGCITIDEVVVKVLKMPVIPNTFTPNGDGVNDEWNIKYLNSYPDVRVEVFNRYGIKVYHSLGYSDAWNGKFNGADLPVGTYYYIINPKSGRKAVSGSVTIIK